MNIFFLIILETMYSAIEHYVNMELYKCCILLLLLLYYFLLVNSANRLFTVDRELFQFGEKCHQNVVEPRNSRHNLFVCYLAADIK